MSTGQKIKEMRKKRSLTQKELAEKTGLSIATIQGYEQNKYIPKFEAFYKLQNALDCNLNDILDPNDIKTTPIINTDFYRDDYPEERTPEQEALYISNKMTNLMEQLNKVGQNKAFEQVELLTKIPEYRKDNK